MAQTTQMDKLADVENETRSTINDGLLLEKLLRARILRHTRFHCNMKFNRSLLINSLHTKLKETLNE